MTNLFLSRSLMHDQRAASQDLGLGHGARKCAQTTARDLGSTQVEEFEMPRGDEIAETMVGHFGIAQIQIYEIVEVFDAFYSSVGDRLPLEREKLQSI